MKRITFWAMMLGTLAALPQTAVAQQATPPVQTTAQTQFLLQDGAVVRRDGAQTTPLTQNVRLANGTKINYKSGIVEFPNGKLTTLKEGDFVRPDGGLVFATPGSAATARGDNSVPAAAAFDTYKIAKPADANAQNAALQLRTQLLERKVALLTCKVALLSQGQPASPEVQKIDLDLTALDAQLGPAN